MSWHHITLRLRPETTHDDLLIELAGLRLLRVGDLYLWFEVFDAV